MSFNFDFNARQEDAEALVAKEHAPECVKAFIAQALKAFKPGDLVCVKAVGHLFNQDYALSTAEIRVGKVMVKELPVVAEAQPLRAAA